MGVRIEGDNAYGLLRSERGTHRLVRISPFDSSHSRHTTFALAEVMPESLRVLFVRAAAGPGPLDWTGERAVHTLVVPEGLR